MAGKKPSASLIAAQQEYFRKHGIQTPEPQKKKPDEIIPAKPKIYSIKEPPTVKEFGIYIATINKAPAVIYMADRQAVEAILAHYDAVLKHITGPNIVREPIPVKEYIIGKGCGRGICHYARLHLGIKICTDWWVTQFNRFDADQNGIHHYWCEVPENCWTTDDLIKSISYRVVRLTEVLNSMQ